MPELISPNSFNTFRIDTKLTFSNLSFFSRKLNPCNTGPLKVRSGSFLTRSLARFVKCFLKIFAIVLGQNVNFFVLRHVRVVGAFLSGKRNSFIIFQSAFGFPTFSDRFSCKRFLFLSLIKASTAFYASVYILTICLWRLFFLQFLHQATHFYSNSFF